MSDFSGLRLALTALQAQQRGVNVAAQNVANANTAGYSRQAVNLVNIGNAHHLNEAQAQGALHACQAAQAAVQNMAQRTAAANELNNAAFVQQQRSVFSSAPANSSSTWQTYLP